ncbi:MAG TPA: hypothetical protein DIT58_13965 [Porticoccaceae bacterium]|nr:hypothetical protein [Porticoccaceae bacterium]
MMATYQFLFLALAAGLAVAAVAGPLGSLVVWQRMAYFGDSIAHSALLGIALGLWLSVPGGYAALVVCVLIALLLSWLEQHGDVSSDTLLGIVSHGALALGLVAITLVPGGRTDMEALLFGDILTVSTAEVLGMWALSVTVLLVLSRLWPSLIALIVHRDLARVEGVPVARYELIAKMLLALTVAIAMKIVGVLLITALLIIPAAAARHFSRTPERMALLASVFAALSVVAGLVVSLVWNAPVGPAMVLAACAMFLLARAMGSEARA